ncbi:MAG TPA: VOC family protein [Candidatus Binataceae bacterium]|nr:VOC family protein [Candidatus Binataceae bacterium]
MARGGINHLALTVSDLERSAKFYDEVLGLAGYTRQEVPESTQTAMKTRLLAWVSPAGSVTMRPAKGESADKTHDRNAPGLNHIAFAVECRTDVDEVHERLEKMGAQILDAPAEYPYFPGYYAVYFTDPDGLKLEFVYWPQP